MVLRININAQTREDLTNQKANPVTSKIEYTLVNMPAQNLIAHILAIIQQK